PRPLRSTQARRDSGAARTSSSRPEVSSVAHPDTRVTAAKPATTNSSWTSSWRNPPAEVRSKPGKTLRTVLARAGEWAKASPSERLAAAMASPNAPRPRPQARAMGSRSPKDRPSGPRSPTANAGRPGTRTAADAARWRRANASMPRGMRTAATTATGTSEAQSTWPARGRWLAVHAHGVTWATPANAGTRVLYLL